MKSTRSGKQRLARAWLAQWMAIVMLAGAVLSPDPSVAAEEPFTLRVTAVSAGEVHILAVLNDGTVRAWGRNNVVQLGNNSVQDGQVAMPVYEWYNGSLRNLRGIKAVAAGPQYSLALNEDGVVYSWGFNASHELGRPAGIVGSAAEPIPGLPRIKKIQAGMTHALALSEDGTVYAWGDNQWGQGGIGTSGSGNYLASPVQVQASAGVPLTGVVDIVSRGIHNLALLDDGRVLGWGYNGNGQLGQGSFMPRDFPYPVPITKNDGSALTDIRAIGGGSSHSFAVSNDGEMWAWGDNGSGRLGLNSPDTYHTRAGRVVDANGGAFAGVVYVDGGSSHSVAVKDDGTLWVWGGEGGKLGLGSGVSQTSVPRQLIESADPDRPLTDVAYLAAGSEYTVALRTDGTLWVTGSNQYYQLAGARSDAQVYRFEQVTMTDPRQATVMGDAVVEPKASTTVYLQVADYWKRNVSFGTDRVTFETDMGIIGPVTYRGNGQFGASFQSDVLGTATVRARINGILVPHQLEIAVNEADKTALNAAIAEAQAELSGTVEGSDPGQYPATARTALNAAIVAAQSVAGDALATSAEVEQARVALASAIATYQAAVVPEADKAALNEAIAEAQAELSGTVEGSDPGQYPASARTALNAAIVAAQAVAGDALATSAEVEQARVTLASTIAAYQAAVVLEADKTALTAVIAEAQTELSGTVEGSDPGQYPASVRTALTAAIATAQAVAGDALATLAEVEQARLALASAIAAYQAAVVPEADKTALTEEIAEAQAKLAGTVEGNDPGQYPASARTALTAAIATAQAVASDVLATAAEVEQARVALASAIATYQAVVVPEADKTVLNEVIAEAQAELAGTVEGNDPGQYPASARTALTAAIATAQAVASDALAMAAEVEQARVALASALAAYQAAVVPEADKTALTEEIAEARTELAGTVEGTDPGQYPASARTALTAAIATAQAVASDVLATAAQVEQALEALVVAITAYNAAVVSESDKTALAAAIAEGQAELSGTVEGSDPGQYPAAARIALNAAIATAQAVAGNALATSAEVEQARVALTSAIAAYQAAVVSEADKTALTAAITEAQAKLAGTVEGSDPGQYPAGARTALTAAIATAQAVASNAQATAAQVEQALDALFAAISAYQASVVSESDKTALAAAITEAQAELSSTVEGSDPGQYPASARTALSDAITTAQAVASNAQATAAQVEQALDALVTAISAYQAAVVSEANKTALNAAITEAQAELSVTVEGSDPGQYPASARTALTAAIATAQAVAGNAFATSAEVEQARVALASAISAYQAAVVSEADKTALNAAITEAQAELSSTVEGTDPGQYPASARAALNDAITTVQAFASNAQATAAQVEEARAAVASALATYRASAVPQPDAPQWESGAEALVEERGISHIKLSWPGAQALAGIEGYRIYIGAEARLLAELTGDQSLSYDAIALDSGTRYVFLIRAYNAAGESQGLPVETMTLPDLTSLNSQIALAERRLMDTTQGVGPGQYPTQARAVLAAAIAAAKAVAQQTESLQQEVDAAAATLQQAIVGYNQAVVRPVDPPAPTFIGVSPSANTQLKVLQLSAAGTVLPLMPGFNAETTSYQAETTASELALRIEAADAKATLSIIREGDGQRLEAGTIWPLQLGANRYRITVKAENGTEGIYTLTVQRLADEQVAEPKPPTGTPPAQEGEPPVAPVFTDTIGHWAEEQIRRAASGRWVQGYPDQAFRPGQAVTRAEFIVMLVQALRPDAAAGASPSFSDEHSWGAWAKPSIQLAVELGWIRGYADGSFRPDREISRAEMAVVLARVLGIAASESKGLPFVDGAAIPTWAHGSVEALYAQGILAGREGGQFAPAASTTRAEAVVVLLRALDS